MAQYQITVDSQLLHQLFLGNTQDAGVAKLLESVMNQLLQAQATEQLRAEPYERTEERKGYRNGTYPHQLTTRVGTITLRVPRIRGGKFSTELFARYQRSEQALVLALMEMVVGGVSTRKVAQITEELCGTEFSKSTVSELCKRLDPVVTDWNNRPLHDHSYPFVLVDALVIKVREDGRVRPRGALIGIGVNTDGYREVLGFMLGDSESEASWGEFFSWLKSRGLRGVDRIVSDDHGGLVRAIRKHFQGVTWQRCQTHFLRNILDATPKACKMKYIAGYGPFSGVRDYIHVVDLAKGHVKALEKNKAPGVNIYNMGTGRGYSVLEMIQAFEKVTGRKIPYEIVGRRKGDVAISYADVQKSNKDLDWKAEKDIHEMCKDAWNWQSNNPNGYE